VCTCFGILRQIRSIRRSVPRSTLSMLISSSVMSKLDYCNVALAGLPSCDLDHIVRHQRCRTPDSWRAAPRPHHSAPCRPPLVVYTSVHPVQAVRTGLPVHSRVRTELSAERHLPCHECGIAASPVFCIIGRSHRAGDVTYNNGRPRLRSTARLQQSAGHDPSQPISCCLQTFTETHFYIQCFY